MHFKGAKQTPELENKNWRVLVVKVDEEIKKIVREGYGRIALENTSCCALSNLCCGGNNVTQDISKRIGYTEKELNTVPEGAYLSLGCGNPVAFASLKEGESVLDLGSGAGVDCFLAAKEIGEKGEVIGVDMTPEMVKKARENAEKGGYKNVKFLLGEIENLPVADNSVDGVISNCVINLSPNKMEVFKEAFRVLKPGGRLIISDIVLLKELPDFMKRDVGAYIGCISGAGMKEEYIRQIGIAGFQDVRLIGETSYPVEVIPSKEIREIASSVVSIKVYGVKCGG